MAYCGKIGKKKKKESNVKASKTSIKGDESV